MVLSFLAFWDTHYLVNLLVVGLMFVAGRLKLPFVGCMQMFIIARNTSEASLFCLLNNNVIVVSIAWRQRKWQSIAFRVNICVKTTRLYNIKGFSISLLDLQSEERLVPLLALARFTKASCPLDPLLLSKSFIKRLK